MSDYRVTTYREAEEPAVRVVTFAERRAIVTHALAHRTVAFNRTMPDRRALRVSVLGCVLVIEPLGAAA